MADPLLSPLPGPPCLSGVRTVCPLKQSSFVSPQFLGKHHILSMKNRNNWVFPMLMNNGEPKQCQLLVFSGNGLSSSEIFAVGIQK